jgi:hypothetical protein
MYLPVLRVIGRDAETNLGAHFESSVLGQKDDVGRLEGVLGGEKDASMVYTPLEVRAGRA